MKSHFEALDGVRGLAVLIVFLSHTSGRGMAIAPFLEFHGIGHVGVYLFFALSGFLLTKNMIDEYKFNKRISLLNFYIRRFFRIAPLYYFSLLFVMISQTQTLTINKHYLHIDDGWHGFIKHLIFYQGDGLFWTIPVEISFYLFLPFMFLVMIRLEDKKAISIAVVAILIFSSWTILAIANVIENLPSPKFLDIKHKSQFVELFLCGSLIAYLNSKDNINEVLKRKMVLDTIAVFSLVVMIITLILVSNKFFIFSRPFYEFRWFSIIYGVTFSLMIVASLSTGLLNQFFSQRWIRFIGVVGFSWYLVHFEVIRVVNFLSIYPYQRFLLSLFACSILSSILYISIEKPFMSIAKNVTGQR